MSRFLNSLIICFWLAAMSWLAVTKVIPPLLGGDPPDYTAVLAESLAEPDCWRIRWDEQPLGFAASRVIHAGDGSAEIRSIVDFDELPVRSIARELLGPMGSLVTSSLGDTDLKVEMRFATRMYFSRARALSGFVMTFSTGQQDGLVRVEGHVDETRTLHLLIYMETDGAQDRLTPSWKHKVHLPSGLVSESLAPRSQLKGLYVGQKWTVPVYRAFPPNNPIRIIEAEVVRHEVIFWDGEDVETMLVVYRAESGSNIQAAREVLGSEWISPAGTVLRQEVVFSGIRLHFERLSNEAIDHRKDLMKQTESEFWSRLEWTPLKPTAEAADRYKDDSP